MPAGTCHDESAGLQRVLRPGSLSPGVLGQSQCTAFLRFVDCASLPQFTSHYMSPLITVQPPSPKKGQKQRTTQSSSSQPLSSWTFQSQPRITFPKHWKPLPKVLCQFLVLLGVRSAPRPGGPHHSLPRQLLFVLATTAPHPPALPTTLWCLGHCSCPSLSTCSPVKGSEPRLPNNFTVTSK